MTSQNVDPHSGNRRRDLETQWARITKLWNFSGNFLHTHEKLAEIFVERSCEFISLNALWTKFNLPYMYSIHCMYTVYTQ